MYLPSYRSKKDSSDRRQKRRFSFVRPFLWGILLGISLGVAACFLTISIQAGLNVPFIDRTNSTIDVSKEIITLPGKFGDEPLAEIEGDPAGTVLPDANGRKPNSYVYNISQPYEVQNCPVTKKPPEVFPAAIDPETNSDNITVPNPAQIDPLKKNRFLVQIGVFKSEEKASALKARLALIGVNSYIQTTEIPDLGKIYRVRAGLFNTVEDAIKIRDHLKRNNMDATIIKKVQ